MKRIITVRSVLVYLDCLLKISSRSSLLSFLVSFPIHSCSLMETSFIFLIRWWKCQKRVEVHGWRSSFPLFPSSIATKLFYPKEIPSPFSFDSLADPIIQTDPFSCNYFLPFTLTFHRICPFPYPDMTRRESKFRHHQQVKAICFVRQRSFFDNNKRTKERKNCSNGWSL